MFSWLSFIIIPCILYSWGLQWDHDLSEAAPFGFLQPAMALPDLAGVHGTFRRESRCKMIWESTIWKWCKIYSVRIVKLWFFLFQWHVERVWTLSLWSCYAVNLFFFARAWIWRYPPFLTAKSDLDDLKTFLHWQQTSELHSRPHVLNLVCAERDMVSSRCPCCFHVAEIPGILGILAVHFWGSTIWQYTTIAATYSFSGFAED